ncbi:bestrophin family protein [Flavobacterium sp. JP2137]|uniref:bestrophin family protein n=1 Tax=Flavobacterium sp. JP2137 TaxID=3414510 RepID=UPI003D2FE0F5
MIVRYRSTILRMLFSWKGSVLKKIYPILLLLFVFSWLVYGYHINFPQTEFPLNVTVFTLMGISLAIFLGFCNSAAYDRFWEGRKLWGSLVIHSRSLAFQLLNYIDTSKKEQSYSLDLIIAFSYALNGQLRNQDAMSDMRRLLPEAFCDYLADKKYKPAVILNELTRWLHVQHKEGKIDSVEKIRIDQNINELSVILGGCERILHTRIPFVYFVLLHRTVYVYCFMLPFGLIDTISWAMPFFVTFVGYSFIALDAIVAEISEPFGFEENDLALDNMCQNIEYSLCELAEKPLPEVKAHNRDFVLT